MTEFSAGQVWTYHTRSGEENSRVVICRVEANEALGPIIHVHVEGVAIKSPAAPGGVTHVVGHMPFAQEAVRESVVSIESTRASLPDYEEGYNTWKEAFDRGSAGVFTVSIAESVDFMEAVLNR